MVRLRLTSLPILALLLGTAIGLPPRCVCADEGADAKQAAREVTAEGLTLRIPKTWKQQKPTNRLRLAQFEVPGPSDEHGSAELSVFHFAVSSPQSNIARWKAAFQPKGRTTKVLSGKFHSGTYVLADITGIYNKPTGKANAGGFASKTKPAPGHRMLAVMLLIKDRGAHFLKLVGDEATVAAAAGDFRATFGGDASTEQPYSPTAP